MAPTGLNEAAQGPSSPRPSTSVNEEPQPQPSPAVDIPIVSLTIPQGQEDHDGSAPAGTNLEPQPQPQPAADAPVTDPITHQVQNSPEASTPTANPADNPADTNLDDQPLTPSLVHLITRISVDLLANSLSKLIKNIALILGSQAAYYTIFEPAVSEIRAQLPHLFPDTTASGLINIVADIMIQAWCNKCRRVIARAWEDMHRDLIEQAKKRVEDMKPRIAAAVATQMAVLAEQESARQELEAQEREQEQKAEERAASNPDGAERPTTPAPTASDFLTISRHVENLTIREISPLQLHPPPRRVPQTPRSARPTAPARFAMPDTTSRGQRGKKVGATPDSHSARHELAGRIGDHPVYSLVKFAESPPA
ncbi:hypothetical protein HD806DRAFT_534400 [Xylariaceae sp. AK1471]|nr:hypothetical protein HD806DRAFT_534400 [Xylariaceae sp. AK1471]